MIVMNVMLVFFVYAAVFIVC